MSTLKIVIVGGSAAGFYAVHQLARAGSAERETNLKMSPIDRLIADHRTRLTVHSGLTGCAQVYGNYNYNTPRREKPSLDPSEI